MILEIGKWQENDSQIMKKYDTTNTHLINKDGIIFSRNKPTDNWRVVILLQIATKLTQGTYEIMGQPADIKHTTR